MRTGALIFPPDLEDADPLSGTERGSGGEDPERGPGGEDVIVAFRTPTTFSINSIRFCAVASSTSISQVIRHTPDWRCDVTAKSCTGMLRRRNTAHARLSVNKSLPISTVTLRRLMVIREPPRAARTASHRERSSGTRWL